MLQHPWLSVFISSWRHSKPPSHQWLAITLSLGLVSLLSGVLITIQPGTHEGYSLVQSSTQFHSDDASNTSYEKGIQAYRDGQYRDAVGLFQQAQGLDPKNPNIHYYLALCFDKLVRYQDAVTQYQFVATHGDDPQVVDYARYRLKSLKDRITSSNNHLASVSAVNPVTVTASSRLSRIQESIVPLKKNAQALMLEATLNNQVSGTFILDTGATYTSISRDMADQLGLDLENAPKVRITTANGRIEVPKVLIERLTVNGLEAHDVEATVIDIRKGSSFSGLLGLSFIKKFKLTIDPQAEQLIFQPL